MKKSITARTTTPFLFFVLLYTFLLAVPEGYAADTVRQTEFGKVQGKEYSYNTLAWLGIPYAKPPVGELRWKSPRDPEPWEATREATGFCSACTQYKVAPRPGRQYNTVLGSEDCLYLNIWRPNTDETGLPVFFWIHGGSNMLGDGTLDMAYFAQKTNMVVVSPNYRLGLFGWLTHPALRGGVNTEEDSGNFGTLDIIKALTWVQNNSAAFGGAPENVTIAGESAGGRNVVTLLLSPRAAGLFHRALVSSPASPTCPVKTGEECAQRTLNQLLLQDGLAGTMEAAQAYADTMSHEQIRQYLYAKASNDLLKRFNISDEDEIISFSDSYNYSMFRDGYVLPAKGIGAVDNGSYNKVPIILGNCRDEIRETLTKTNYFYPYFSEMNKWAPRLSIPRDKQEIFETAAYYGNRIYKSTWVDSLARKLRQQQQDVYVFRFDKKMPYPFTFTAGSSHGNDLFFMTLSPLVIYFTNRSAWYNASGANGLQKALKSYIAAFARTGNPNSAGNVPVQWSAWSNTDGEKKTMLLDAGPIASRLSMSTEELVREEVIDDMAATLPAATYEIITRDIFTEDFLKQIWLDWSDNKTRN
jgi:para-nitrobenzyl esterase